MCVCVRALSRPSECVVLLSAESETGTCLDLLNVIGVRARTVQVEMKFFFFITSLKYELNGSGCVGSTPLYRPRLNDRWTVFPLVAIRWWWWWWLSLSRKRNMAYKRACGFFFIKGVFIQTRKRETLLSSHKTKINKNQNKNTSELYIYRFLFYFNEYNITHTRSSCTYIYLYKNGVQNEKKISGIERLISYTARART